MSSRSRSTAATARSAAACSLRPATSSPSSRAIAANSRRPGRQVEAHHVRQQQAVARAVRAVVAPPTGYSSAWTTATPTLENASPASVAARAMPSRASRSLPSRHGPAQVLADQRDRLLRQHVAQRVLALVDACARPAAAGSRRCPRRCTPRWRASGRRCRCRPSPSAGRTRVSSGSTTATRGRR